MKQENKRIECTIKGAKKCTMRVNFKEDDKFVEHKFNVYLVHAEHDIASEVGNRLLRKNKEINE